jgi:hypothetical protein
MAKIYDVVKKEGSERLWSVVGLKDRLADVWQSSDGCTTEWIQVSYYDEGETLKGWWADGDYRYATASEAFNHVLYDLCQMNDDLKAGDMFHVAVDGQQLWFVFESVWVIRLLLECEIPTMFEFEQPRAAKEN